MENNVKHASSHVISAATGLSTESISVAMNVKDKEKQNQSQHKQHSTKSSGKRQTPNGKVKHSWDYARSDNNEEDENFEDNSPSLDDIDQKSSFNLIQSFKNHFFGNNSSNLDVNLSNHYNNNNNSTSLNNLSNGVKKRRKSRKSVPKVWENFDEFKSNY